MHRKVVSHVILCETVSQLGHILLFSLAVRSSVMHLDPDVDDFIFNEGVFPQVRVSDELRQPCNRDTACSRLIGCAIDQRVI